MTTRSRIAKANSFTRRPWRRLWCEQLEDRTTPTTFTVLNTNDAGPGSLRQAILNANTTPGFDTIDFAIAGGGVQTIQPLSALPTLTDTAGVVINGFSQPDAGENTLAVGNNAVLTIELDGSLAGAGTVGLSVSVGNSTIQGLVINRFGGSGIRVLNVGGNTVRGNFVGTDPTGTIDLGNGGDGIRVETTSGTNVIGGTTPGDRNLISGNTVNGVNLANATVVGVGNIVLGNYIGTTASGMAPLGNGVSSMHGPINNGVVSSGGNIIGGTALGAGNLISGNLTSGIYDQGFDDVIQGNILGLNATATAELRNGNWDVVAGQCPRVLIGGTTPGAGNVTRGIQAGGNGQVIQGNFVGTNRDGTFVFENGGLQIGDSNTLIGGTASGAGNIIVRAVGDAMRVSGSGHVIQGNFIGTNAAGANLGNASGVAVIGGSNITIGGTAPGAGNVIAFSSIPANKGGIYVTQNVGTGVSIRGNSIHHNGGLGIDLSPFTTSYGDGVTPNDQGDADTGPNSLQNFPVITLAEPGSTTRVVGTLNSTPNSTFWLDFYANTEPDSSGYGEGERYLGAISVTANEFGIASFDSNVPGASTMDEYVSATATNSAGSTSEFSVAVNPTPANTGPTANAGGPYTVVRGGTVRVDASGTTDAQQPNTTLTYEWDFDSDGDYDDATGMTPTFSADGIDTPGVRTVGLRVTDAGGLSDTATATITIVVAAVLPDPCDPAATALFVGGTSGGDDIVVSPSTTAGEVEVTLNGTSLGSFAPTGRVVVYAQAGDDDVQVTGSFARPAWLYGGDGDDRLKGGAGHDVLLGGAGADLLVGGGGRDLLIGGTGADRIVGNAEDDILIAGSTAFDDDPCALRAVLAEWTRTDRDYEQRVAALQSGVGNDNPIRLDATTVFDDGVQDVLTGSAGQDWFLVNLFGGGVYDKVTDLSASEFADDLDFING